MYLIDRVIKINNNIEIVVFSSSQLQLKLHVHVHVSFYILARCSSLTMRMAKEYLAEMSEDKFHLKLRRTREHYQMFSLSTEKCPYTDIILVWSTIIVHAEQYFAKVSPTLPFNQSR